jgi:trk system potassium uptake protein
LLNLPIASRDGQNIGFVDALFTATSAVCVTGLVVVDTYTHWTSFGQVIILGLIQIGGLGFMTMATLFSFILRRKISYSERLVMAESLNQDNLQGIVRQVKRILLGTLFFEFIGAVLLSLRFIRDFGFWGGITKGVFHAVSAFCNAGFDLMGSQGKYSSLTNYSEDITVNLVVVSLVLIGGIGFVVWNDIFYKRKLRTLNLHSKLVLTTSLILVIFGFISCFSCRSRQS